MISLQYDDQGVDLRLTGMKGRIREALRSSLLIQAQLFRNYVITTKLLGQVLHQRSGNLIRSIYVASVNEGNTIGFRVAEGPEAWYGKLHEFGGTFMRRVGTAGAAGIVNIVDRPRALRSSALDGYGTVTFPVRAHMRPALAERRQAITDAVRERVAAAAVGTI